MLKGSFVAAALGLGLACSASLAGARVYDLTADFSNTDNPNCAWSFTNGATFMFHYTVTAPHPFNPAVEDGTWGQGFQDYNSTVLRVTQDATAIGGNSGNFLAGDVIVHGANPGTAGGNVRINWTAPTRGTIEFSGVVWYAHVPINRVATYKVSINNGDAINAGTLTISNDRNSSIPLSSFDPLEVLGGDKLVLEFAPAAGQQFASLAGVQLTVTFTPATDLCDGDANGDNAVDFNDLNLVLSGWDNNCTGDVNDDGDTDFNDLNEVLANFGLLCAAE